MAEWKMKAKVECNICNGVGYFGSGADIISDPPHECLVCYGKGFVMKSVQQKEIRQFLEPEQKQFDCVCGKKENILRPKENQIPHGWINWNGSFLCPMCLHKVIHTLIIAANQKVNQLKTQRRK